MMMMMTALYLCALLATFALHSHALDEQGVHKLSFDSVAETATLSASLGRVIGAEKGAPFDSKELESSLPGFDIHYNPPEGFRIVRILDLVGFDNGALAIYAVMEDIEKNEQSAKVIYSPDGVTFPPEKIYDLPSGDVPMFSTQYIPHNSTLEPPVVGIFTGGSGLHNLEFCNVDPSTGLPECTNHTANKRYDKQEPPNHVDYFSIHLIASVGYELALFALRHDCTVNFSFTDKKSNYTLANTTRLQLRGPDGEKLENCISLTGTADYTGSSIAALIVSTSATAPVVIPGYVRKSWFGSKLREFWFEPVQQDVHYLEGYEVGANIRLLRDNAFTVWQTRGTGEVTIPSTILSPLTIMRWNETGYPARHFTRYLSSAMTHPKDVSRPVHRIPGSLPDLNSGRCNYAYLGDYASNGYIITLMPTTSDPANAKIIGKLYRPSGISDLDGRGGLHKNTLEPDDPPLVILEYEFSDVGKEGLMRWVVDGKDPVEVRTPARTLAQASVSKRRSLYIIIDLHIVEVYGDGMSLTSTYPVMYTNPTFGRMCFQSAGTAPVSFTYASSWVPYRNRPSSADRSFHPHFILFFSVLGFALMNVFL